MSPLGKPFGQALDLGRAHPQREHAVNQSPGMHVCGEVIQILAPAFLESPLRLHLVKDLKGGVDAGLGGVAAEQILAEGMNRRKLGTLQRVERHFDRCLGVRIGTLRTFKARTNAVP